MLYTKEQLTLPQLYCPLCKKKLVIKVTIDIHAQHFECSNKHRFVIWNQLADGKDTVTAYKLPPIEHHDHKQIIRAWLENKTYRECLNDQLAYFLRRIYEIEEANLLFPEIIGDRFQFCMFCRSDLHRYEQDNHWVEGVECKNGHRFLKRAGVSFEWKNTILFVETDTDDETTCSMISHWLNSDNRLQQNQVHLQIRKILENFYEARCKPAR